MPNISCKLCWAGQCHATATQAWKNCFWNAVGKKSKQTRKVCKVRKVCKARLLRATPLFSKTRMPRPAIDALADIAGFDIAKGQGRAAPPSRAQQGLPPKPRPPRRGRVRREDPIGNGNQSTRPRRVGRMRTENPIGDGGNAGHHRHSGGSAAARMQVQQQSQQQQYTQHAAASRPSRPSVLRQRVPKATKRFTLYVRQPAHACKLTGDAIALARELPNLPPIDIIHLVFCNINHPHIVATPSLADSQNRQIYRGYGALEWLQAASEAGTRKAEQESKRRVKQTQSKSAAINGGAVIGSASGRLKKAAGKPKPPPNNAAGFVSEEELQAAARRRAAKLDQLREQAEADGATELPAPRPPI